MPYRDPADRIARISPGFSRMLATVQPETRAATRSRQVNSKSRHAEYEYEDEVVNLPPVKFDERPHTAALPFVTRTLNISSAYKTAELQGHVTVLHWRIGLSGSSYY
jgi:hypothetical protein